MLLASIQAHRHELDHSYHQVNRVHCPGFRVPYGSDARVLYTVVLAETRAGTWISPKRRVEEDTAELQINRLQTRFSCSSNRSVEKILWIRSTQMMQRPQAQQAEGQPRNCRQWLHRHQTACGRNKWRMPATIGARRQHHRQRGKNDSSYRTHTDRNSSLVPRT